MKKILSLFTVTSLSFAITYTDIGTDYNKAITNSYYQDNALMAMETVNMIMSFMSQTKADQFINNGNYKALLKQETQQGSAKQAGTSSTTTEQLSEMTLNVQRDNSSDTAPMIVKFWMDEKDDMNDGAGNGIRIRGHFNIEKGVSSEYPYGKFTMQFGAKNIQNDGSIGSTERMRGVLFVDANTTTHQAIVKFDNNVSDGNGNSEFQKLNLTLNVNAADINQDGDTNDLGEAKGFGKLFTQYSMYDPEEGSVQYAYKIALGHDGYLVQDVNASNNYVNVGSPVYKDKSNEIYKVFKYGLYHESNGSKVSMNSGFPIVKGSGSSAFRGYVGYWGLWSDGDSIVNGDTLKRDDGTSGTYTAVVAPGKLKKYTKNTTTLSNIADSKLYFFNQNDGKQYILAWDSTNQKFKILGTQNNYGEADTQVLSSLISNSGNYFVFDNNGTGANKLYVNNWSGAWSEALNANIPIDSTFTNSSVISYHKEEVVTPASSTTLINFGWETINTEMNLSTASNADINTSLTYQEGKDNNITVGRYYQYNEPNMTLIDLNSSTGSKAVIIPSDANFTSTNKEWWKYGVQIGPLLTTDRAGSYNGNNFWEVEQNENIYYKWEIGTQQWNKFSGVKNSSGDIVSFDPPIRLNYVHTSSNDANGATNNSGTYAIDYDGNTLNVPWTYSSKFGWVPKINIKSGTQISDGSNNYRVKILDQGISSGSGTDSENLSVADITNTTYNGPDYNATLVNNLGDKPRDANVTVIKGECVFKDCAMN